MFRSRLHEKVLLITPVPKRSPGLTNVLPEWLKWIQGGTESRRSDRIIANRHHHVVKVSITAT